ncbi:MAG: WecB/TagA/CpsF family glycosyltransferase [Clostridium sp.]|nr:WecB/TagA/CpsF family glycosyltransferase [Clostridium sp.]MDU7083466.1 WecB/TagA/CpsF family glycosyltransferase [Clostridium sp.]
MRELLEKIYNKSQKEFFDLLEKNIKNEKKMFVVTANPETLMIGVNNPEFHEVLKQEKVTITPDGIGVVKALGALNIDVEGRITGVDISKHLLKIGNENNKSVYLYGAKPEVLEALVTKLGQEYPNLTISGSRDGYNNDGDEVFKDIIEKKPDIILVALGIPRQELLISKYFDEIEKGIFVGVGGTFDVLSGTKKRAPQMFIKLNLEWLYRIGKEPKRFGRFYKSNVKFIKIINKLKQEGK